MLRKRKEQSSPVVTLIDPNQRWMLVPDAARYLCVSPQTIRALIHRGEFPAVRMSPAGGGYHLDKNDLDKWLERQKRIVRPYRRGSRPWVAKRWATERQKRSAS